VPVAEGDVTNGCRGAAWVQCLSDSHSVVQSRGNRAIANEDTFTRMTRFPTRACLRSPLANALRRCERSDGEATASFSTLTPRTAAKQLQASPDRIFM